MISWAVLTLMRRVYGDVAAGDLRLVRVMVATDAELVFPGNSRFGGTYRGRAEVLGWIERFAACHPRIDVLDAMTSGPPWNMRVAVRLDDAIGEDYQNRALEMVTIRWGRVRRLEVFVDTERIAAWEARHPELTAPA